VPRLHSPGPTPPTTGRKRRNYLRFPLDMEAVAALAVCRGQCGGRWVILQLLLLPAPPRPQPLEISTGGAPYAEEEQVELPSSS
jgi:hypothetical protein